MRCMCPAEKQRYERIGESTEVALRVLVEKIGLRGVDVGALGLSRQERASHCNSHWEGEHEKVGPLLQISSRILLIAMDLFSLPKTLQETPLTSAACPAFWFQKGISVFKAV